jgi:hypothetical protein
MESKIRDGIIVLVIDIDAECYFSLKEKILIDVSENGELRT